MGVPQHRLVVNNWRSKIIFGSNEVLATAKSLVDGDRVFVDPRAEVEYFHLQFDQHELINSTGAWTESFHPGAFALNEMQEDTREELFKLFPHMRISPDEYGPPVRKSLNFNESLL